MFLNQEDILPRLKELAYKARRISVATAWASPGKALGTILGSGKEIRAIIGIYGAATYPGVFKDLDKAKAQVRIPLSPPLFHPKLILFELEDKTLAWIGSANLTRAGYELNTEIIAEFEDDGKALHWFDERWNELENDCSQTITAYVNSWERPKRSVSGKTRAHESNGAELIRGDLIADLGDWPSFVRAIGRADKLWSNRNFWSVTGERASWVNTASLGHSIVIRDDWDDLTYLEYRILLGVELKDDQSAYGLLGSMKGAGRAKGIFHTNTIANRRTRRKIRKSLQIVIDASFESFPDAASQCIAEISSIEGIAAAVATRFVTLARPDLGISVNNASQAGLSKLTGLAPASLGKPTSLGEQTGYGAMLRALQKYEWYADPSPADVYEKTLADMRGALLDALIYKV